MLSDSIVPHAGSVINGRKLISCVKENGYLKWTYSCIVHTEQEFPRPMRVKDMRNRKRPICCFNHTRSGKTSNSWKGYEDIPRKLINQIIRGANLRGIDYNLSDEYLWAVWVSQEGKCAYTKRLLILGYDASLDRIDSSKGYQLGNVEWVYKNVNMAKQGFSKDIFIKICKDVAWAQQDSAAPGVIADFSAGRI